MRRDAIMSNQGRRNHETEADVYLDVSGTRKKKTFRITGTVHNQFAVSGMWLRGTLHCHLSGHRRPEWLAGVVEHYRRLGYDFFAGMDHNMVVPVDSPPDMLVVPGAEITGPGHVLAFGLDELPQPEQGGDVAEGTAATIRSIKEGGGIAVLAHPIRSGYTWKDLNLLCEAGLDGLEVINCSTRGSSGDAGRSDQIWHLLLRDGRSLIPLGTDDAHRPHEDLTSSGWGGVTHAAWTGVLAREFSVRGILEAIREGRTYASEGPEVVGIEFQDDGKLTVSSSPCVACHFRSVGGRLGGNSVFPPQGEASAERFVFEFKVAGHRLQDRLVIVLEDAFGRRAWVSPIRLSLAMEETLNWVEAMSSMIHFLNSCSFFI
jgi:hypothetical protein